jgi:hypothetical protein
MTDAQLQDAALDALIDSIPKFLISLSVNGELVAELLAFAHDAEAAVWTAKQFYIALGHAESVVNNWDWVAVQETLQDSRSREACRTLAH